jgi:hypothetical protein
VGKYFEVRGLYQGIALGKKGVTKISPSNPKTGGENSTGILPNFKLRETPTDGIIGKREENIGFYTRG